MARHDAEAESSSSRRPLAIDNDGNDPRHARSRSSESTNVSFSSPRDEKPDAHQADKDHDKKAQNKKSKKIPKRDLPIALNLSERRKWTILSVIMLVQVSMNFNTSAYSSGITGIAEEFRISEQAARVGQSVFLITYAVGSQLWAPWSDASVVVGRFFGGLFSAGGSVTLGTMADLWEAEHQGPAVIAVVFASVLGAALGPIPCNAIVAASPPAWRWTIWIQLILGGVTQLAHLLLVPETRETVLIEREVERRKRAGESVEGIEVPKRMEFTMRNIFVTWIRPFDMMVREPIVLCLSLLSGFSDALIFTALEAFNLVYKQWGFTQAQIGACYVPIIIGYVIGAASFFYPYHRFKKLLRAKANVTPEYRLWWLLFLAPFLPIGLFGFAWTSWPRVHWIASMVFTMLIGLANYAVYLACIDYTIAAYGPYSSSATAGNAFARDGIAGAATMYATPMYERLGLQWASSLLGFVALAMVVPVYVFYIYGRRIRLASPFAQELARKEDENEEEDEEARAVGRRFRG